MVSWLKFRKLGYLIVMWLRFRSMGLPDVTVAEGQDLGVT
jgi:hypothetical protein